MTEASTFQSIVAVANGVLSILACLLVLALMVGGVVAWRALGRARAQLAAVQRDVTPLLATMGRVATNLEAVTSTIRSDVEAIHGTLAHANERAGAAIQTAEYRLRRLDAVVGATQEEVEAALVDVVGAARGLRAGAAALRGVMGLAQASTRRNPARRDPSSDGLPDPGGPLSDEETTALSGEDADDVADQPGPIPRGTPRPRARSRRTPG